MVLAVDVGNTNIAVAGIIDGETEFSFRMATDLSKTNDQYSAEIASIIQLHKIELSQFDGLIISSVVPQLTPVLKSAFKLMFDCKVVTVGPGVKTGLNIKINDPGILGADLVCGAVAALKKYPMPCIIFDLGTATTMSVLDKSGGFLGGSIFPGVRVSLNALSSMTAQLPYINLDTGDDFKVIGGNTIDSMKSGMILGTASMIDGMIIRGKESLGEENVTVVVTGGLSGAIIPHCRENVTHDPNLLTDGLYEIYLLNKNR